MAITWTDDETTINTCQAKGDWSGSGFSDPDDNNSGSTTPIYREGTGCMAANAKSNTAGSWDDPISVDLSGVALVWWIWLSGPTEMAYFTYFRTRVSDGGDYVEFDYWPEMTTIGNGGWFPAVLWPTDDGEPFINSSGTLNEATIDEVGIYANNGTGTDAKLVGWDYIHSLSYIGAAGDTVTLEDFVTEDAANNFGVVTQVGDTFQAQCNLRYGGTGTTTVNESNKTLTFRGANSDHPVGIIFNSGGTATNITWSDMVFNWTYPQDVFTLTGSPDDLKIDGCQFVNGGDIELPAHNTDRWVKTSKFNDCGEIDIGDITFEDNIISNATSGVFYTGTGTRRAKDNTYEGNTDAIHFDTAQTISLDGDQFSGNTDDIHFSGSGTLTINAINGANPVTWRASGGGTVVIVNAVLVKVTCKDASTQANIQGARVLLEADTGGDLPVDASVTITRSGTTASVSHTAHGMSDGQKVVIRGANQEDYNIVAAITNVTTNAYDYTVAGSPTTPATGTITSTAVILDGDTNASGVIEDTGFAYTSDQPVAGRARKGTATIFYKTALISGTMTTPAGFDTTVFMVRDE